MPGRLFVAVILAGCGLMAVLWLRPQANTPPTPTSAPATTQPAPAAAPSPLDLVPADCLLAWKGEPTSDEEAAQQQSALDVLIRTVTKIAGGKIRPAEKLTLRLFQGFGEVIRHPFALALVDADTIPAGRSVKGDNFKIVLVVDMQGKIGPMMTILQNAINELTDESMANLAEKRAAGQRYVELIDKRLPDWCHIAWGEIGRYFVLTFGVDVWPQVAAVAAGERESVTRDKWLAPLRARMAHRALIEIVVDAAAIRDKLDPSTDGKATAFFDAWGAAHMDRSLWALGLKGRALYCEAFFRIEGKTVRRLYADPDISDPALVGVVPDDARYAIYNISIRDFLPRLFASFYATRPAAIQHEATQRWAAIQREHGFDAQTDVLDHLGNRIVLHNSPEHPLHIPLMFTTVVPIRDNAQTVKKTIETMCTAWRNGLQEQADLQGRPNPIKRDPDGFWYISLGIIDGLAWTVTDRYIVTSWSPWALRTYLNEMSKQLDWKP